MGGKQFREREKGTESSLISNNKESNMSSATNLKSKFEQKAADQNKVEYVVGKEKKTWKTTGNSGGGHSGQEGKFQSAVVKEKTQFSKPPPAPKNISQLP